MIKDKKDKGSSGSGGTSGSSGGGSSNNNSGSSNSKNNCSNPSSSSSSTSSPTTSAAKTSTTTTTNANNNKSGSSNSSKSNILGIKEEIIEQGNSEQLIVTSIKHEDGSPPTNIIKKESTSASSSSASGSSSSSNANNNNNNNNNNTNSNDSNNNNETNDNKNSSSTNASMQDDKDSIGGNNDNSITDELLNNDDLGLPGSAAGSNKMGPGMHIKTEDTSGELNPDSFGPMNQGPGGPGGNSCRMMSQSGSPERIQPLPSNVVNKQSNNMEYMQQQSQIFVFSTQLANKGAEAVFSGQFPSIIAYHCAQPGTKKFLEKYPLKLNQFNRQNQNAPWFANMNQMKGKNSRIPNQNQNPNNFMMKNSPMGMQQPPHPPQQQQQQNQGPMHPGGGGPFSQSCEMGNENMMPWGGPHGNQQMGLGDPLGNTGGPNNDPLINSMGFNPDGLVPDVTGSNNSGNNLPHQSPSNVSGGNSMNMDPSSPVPTLQGVKVPDENLTSKQMQSRKEKLAFLNELKSQLVKNDGLFPEGMTEADMIALGAPPMSGPGNQMPAGGPGNVPGGPKMNPMGPNAMNPCQGPPFPMGPRGMGMNMGPGPRGGNMGGMGRPPGPMGMGPNNMNDPMAGPGMPMGGPMGEMPCRPMNPNMPGGGPNMPMGPHPGGPGNPNQMMNPMGMGHMQNMNPMGMNQMGPGPNCNMGPNMGNMMGPKGMNPNMMGPGPNASIQAQMDWNKLQQQYYEENKRKGMPGMPPDMNPNEHGMMSGRPGPGPGMPPGMRNNPNMRGQQGPPPPYHQTPRSASVPIATQSPNPNSPNNPTSNLSLPSPRGGCGSTLNSPAASDNRNLNSQPPFKHMNNPRQSPTASQDSPVGINRQMTSNPSTPISSSHLSPSASLKDLEMGPNPSIEPNLMPVPSPQQISYLNTFEGQELTIQKQPNTNLKDGSSSIGAPNQSNISLDNRLPGQKTPTSQPDSRFSSSTPGSANHFPIPSSPHTPGGTPNPAEKNRINSAGPSPQGLQRSTSLMGNESQPFNALPQPNNSDNNLPPFPQDSPNMPFGPNQQQQNMQQQSQQNAGNPGNPKMGNFMDSQGKGPGEMGGGSPFPQMGGRPENLPLNPNCSVMPNTKPLVHDPISSLAQMSQQLTSSGGGSMNGGGGPPSGMMGGFVNNGMMSDMGPMGQMGQGGPNMNMPDGMGGGMGPGSMDYGMGMGMGPGGPQFGPMGGPQRPMSPKIGPGMNAFPGGPGGMPPRMMGRGPMGPGPYNGTNIQVKPSAPNTIQYLPARPQVSNQNPRGPPSLDFLQRFAGPMNMDDMNKPNNQNNMPFFPNQNNPGNMGGGCGGMDGDNSMGGGMGPMGGMGPNTPPGMMNQGMMMRQMRGGPNMMRFPGPGNNPCMMGNNSFNSSNNLGGNNPNNMGGNDQMFPNSPNPQMFVAGPKGSPMGGPGPMGQNGPNQVPTSNTMNGPPPPEMQQQMCGPGGPGQGPHFNKSHYIGPNTDPNYAQQYHNFQQQLYATNRNQQGGPMGGMGGPNNQSFLMPK